MRTKTGSRNIYIKDRPAGTTRRDFFANVFYKTKHFEKIIIFAGQLAEPY